MSAYLDAVLVDSPVHYWRCADPGGRLLHDIGSSPVQLVVVGGGVVGYSAAVSDGGGVDLILDGNYANTGLPITIQTNPSTLECLVWLDNLAAGNHYLLVPNSATLWAIAHTGTQWTTFFNGSQQTAAIGLTGQTWHHVALTYGAGVQSLYVDGAFIRNQAIAAPAPAASILEVCTFAGASNWGNAIVTEVAVYDVALTAARISAHFAAVDQLANVPVFGASGLGGAPGTGNPAFNGILAEILASVRHTYPF